MTSGKHCLASGGGSHACARDPELYWHQLGISSIAGRLSILILFLVVSACATPSPHVAKYLESEGLSHIAMGDWAGAEEKYDRTISEIQSLKREHSVIAFDCRWLKNLRWGDGCKVDEEMYQADQKSMENVIAIVKQLRAFARLQQNKLSGSEEDADDALQVNPTLPIALYVAARNDDLRHDSKAVRGYITKLRANNDPFSARLAEALLQDLTPTSPRGSLLATRTIRDAVYLNLESMGRRPIMSGEIQHQVLTEYSSRISYELFLPPGWRKPPADKHGMWGVALNHESDPETLYGEFRVRLLHPAFGYDPAWYPDVWSYISKNQNPGIATSLHLQPYTGLKLPPGWEARVSGFMGADQRGRTIWIGARHQDIVFMYMIHVNPYSTTASKDPDKYIQRYHSDVEQMVAKTRIQVKP